MSRLAYTADMATNDPTSTTPSGIYEHYCETCGKWGGLGYSAGSNAPMRWWCERHYPHWPDDVKAKYAALPA